MGAGAFGIFDYQTELPAEVCEGAVSGSLGISHGEGRALTLRADCDEYELFGQLDDGTSIDEGFPWPTVAFTPPVI